MRSRDKEVAADPGCSTDPECLFDIENTYMARQAVLLLRNWNELRSPGTAGPWKDGFAGLDVGYKFSVSARLQSPHGSRLIRIGHMG